MVVSVRVYVYEVEEAPIPKSKLIPIVLFKV